MIVGNTHIFFRPLIGSCVVDSCFGLVVLNLGILTVTDRHHLYPKDCPRIPVLETQAY